jgi:hypothetical protein
MDIVISLLIFLIVAGIVYWLVTMIIGLLPVPQPIKNAILALFLIICLLYVLGIFAGYAPLAYHSHPLLR